MPAADARMHGEDGNSAGLRAHRHDWPSRRRLPEGLAGISQLHALIAGLLPEQWADLPAGEAARQVEVGIETERGSWVAALVAARYEVFPVNPMSVAR